MSKDTPVARIQPPPQSANDSGPAWAPVTNVIEDIGAGFSLSLAFGPTTIEIKAKNEEEAKNVRTILGIFLGAMSGKQFTPTSALQVVTK